MINKINFLKKISTNFISFSLSLFIAYSYLYVLFVSLEIDSESDYLIFDLIVLFLIAILLHFVIFQRRFKSLLKSKKFIRESYSLVSLIFLIGVSLIISIDSNYAFANSAEYGDLDTDVIRNDKVIGFNKVVYPLTFGIGVIIFLLHQIMSLRNNKINYILVQLLQNIFSFLMPILLCGIFSIVFGIFALFSIMLAVYGIRG